MVPVGVDVQGTLVIACVLLDTDRCNETRTGGIAIPQSGSGAAYTIAGLRAGNYVVLAVKVTLDAQGEVKSIDYLGGYGTEQTRVKPGASNIDIALVATAASPPASPVTRGPSPTGSVKAAVVGTWNGRAGGTDIYSIAPNGSYSRTLIDSAGCYRIERREAGTSVTKGNQITFYPASNFSKLFICGSDSENRDPGSTSSFTYRFETDSVNASQYLFLRSKEGSEWQYRRE